MSTKTKKIIISISAAVMVIVAIVAIVLAVYFTRTDAQLYARAREILSMTFKQVDLGEKAKFKREINEDNPLNLVNFYGDVTIESLWEGIPNNQKPYTVILIIMGNPLLPGGEASLTKLEESADKCEALKIPYAVQNINGETHMESRLPIAYLEQRFAQHEYFYGLNAAELYNGIDWRGAAESDQTEYLIDCIKLCAKYGAYFIWTDTNRNYENGMIVDYIENNEALYDTLLSYGKYVCMLNKESFGVPSTNAIMQGLWLAGLIGNWGIASDWWHWQVDGYKTLFDKNNKAIGDEWEQILSFPENMYVQSMMLGVSKGATCFKAEAPIYSTTLNGKPIAGFQYGISPLLDRLISGNIQIPDKETVFKDTKQVVLGGENWIDKDYDFDVSNLYPSRGDGLVPLVPKNLRAVERNIFLSRGIKLVTDMGALAPEPRVASNGAYLTVTGNDWYFINPSENAEQTAESSFKPRVNSATNVSIKSQEHTSAIINEQSGALNFYVSNYRTDKSKMIEDLTKKSREGKNWTDILAEYMLLDEQGNPKGVSDSQKRKVEIVINASFGGGRPIVTYADMGANSRPYNVEEIWDGESKQLRLIVDMNGCLEFSVQMDDSGKTLTHEPRAAITDTIVPTDTDLTALKTVIQEKIVYKAHYTQFSYLVYNKAYSYAVMLANERIGSDEQVATAIRNVNRAVENLTDMSILIQKIDKYLKLNPKDFSSMSYNNASLAVDKALREMLSVKPYSVLRSASLKYSGGYKKFGKGDFKAKSSKLASVEKNLTKALNTLEYVAK